MKPPFTWFRVFATLQVNGAQSGFSEQSNIISKMDAENWGEGEWREVGGVECELYSGREDKVN